MSDATMLVLTLLPEHKITPEQASSLLDTLSDNRILVLTLLSEGKLTLEQASLLLLTPLAPPLAPLAAPPLAPPANTRLTEIKTQYRSYSEAYRFDIQPPNFLCPSNLDDSVEKRILNFFNETRQRWSDWRGPLRKQDRLAWNGIERNLAGERLALVAAVLRVCGSFSEARGLDQEARSRFVAATHCADTYFGDYYNVAVLAERSDLSAVAVQYLLKGLILDASVLGNNSAMWSWCVVTAFRVGLVNTLISTLSKLADTVEGPEFILVAEAVIFLLSSYGLEAEADNATKQLLPRSSERAGVLSELIEPFMMALTGMNIANSVVAKEQIDGFEKGIFNRDKVIAQIALAREYRQLNNVPAALNAVEVAIKMDPMNQIALDLATKYRSDLQHLKSRHSIGQPLILTTTISLPPSSSKFLTSARSSGLSPIQPSISSAHVPSWGRVNGHPKGTTYQRAKWATDELKDLATARQLFLQEVDTKGPKWQAALKDLSRLLMRRDKDGQESEDLINTRYEEAVRLLEVHLPDVSEPISFWQQLAATHQARSHPERALPWLEKIVRNSSGMIRINALRNIALCHLKMGQDMEMEGWLQQVQTLAPHEASLSGLREQLRLLRDAKQRGQSALNTFLQRVASVRGTQSSTPLIDFFLSRNRYEGASEESLARGFFVPPDFTATRSRAERVMTTVPGDAASYYLTCAHLLKEHITPESIGEGKDQDDLFSSQEHGYEGLINDMLTQFCQTRGDASIRDGLDVARTFYGEAFVLGAPLTRRGKEVARSHIKLAQWFMCFYATEPTQLLDNVSIIRPEVCLAEALKSPESERMLRELLLLANANSALAGYLLEKLVLPQANRREAVGRLCRQLIGPDELSANVDLTCLASDVEVTELWARAQQVVQDDWDSLCTKLSRFSDSDITGFDRLPEHIRQMDEVWSKVWGPLDRERLTTVVQIMNELDRFRQQTEYAQRQAAYETAQGRLVRLMGEIEGKPTKLSLEQYLPLLQSWHTLLQSRFDEIARQAEPELSVVAAVEDGFPVESDGWVRCRIIIRNAADKSSASRLNLQLLSSDTEDYELEGQSFYSLPRDLAANSGEELEAPVLIKENARKNGGFDLNYRLHYGTSRSNETLSTEPQSVVIRLYTLEEYHPLEKNPYFPYRGGAPVENKEMLFGRNQLLDQLEQAITDPIPQNVIIYGQKRSGKSSILTALRERLQFPFIPVLFSIGDIQNDIQNRGLAAFRFTVADQIQERLCDLADQVPKLEAIVTDLPRPGLDKFDQGADTLLINHLRSLSRRFRQDFPEQAVRIVLLIDEFTYISNLIRTGALPEVFMNGWKGLIEKKLFSSVLVGQDFMPKFRDRYPNDFQVSAPQRVGYLADRDARDLVLVPLRRLDPERDRISEPATDRLIELTARNPFYLMKLMSAAVEYMNEKRRRVLTAGDIEQIKESLFHGDSGEKVFDEASFDNLLDSGEKGEDAIHPEGDTRPVLDFIVAHSADRRTGCRDELIRSKVGPDKQSTYCVSKPLAVILDDLEKRDVIEWNELNKSWVICSGLFYDFLKMGKSRST